MHQKDLLVLPLKVIQSPRNSSISSWNSANPRLSLMFVPWLPWVFLFLLCFSVVWPQIPLSYRPFKRRYRQNVRGTPVIPGPGRQRIRNWRATSVTKFKKKKKVKESSDSGCPAQDLVGSSYPFPIKWETNSLRWPMKSLVNQIFTSLISLQPCWSLQK